MPWTAEHAQKFTKKADTPAKQKQWADIANKVKEDTGDDSQAIQAANSAIKHGV